MMVQLMGQHHKRCTLSLVVLAATAFQYGLAFRALSVLNWGVKSRSIKASRSLVLPLDATSAKGNEPDVPRKRGLLGRITGDGTPYEFPLRPLEFQKTWPDERPFVKDDFSRLDPFDDGGFYSIPRLVYHIDEPAVAALTQYYRATHL